MEPTSLQDSMLELETATSNMQDIRKQLIAHIYPSILSMELDPSKIDDPEMYHAQARMIAEARQLLSDVESAQARLVTTKQKMKDGEVFAKSQQLNAAAFLARIKMTDLPDNGNITIDPSAITEQIDKRYSDGDFVIPDTELEVGGSMLPKKQINQDE